MDPAERFRSIHSVWRPGYPAAAREIAGKLIEWPPNTTFQSVSIVGPTKRSLITLKQLSTTAIGELQIPEQELLRLIGVWSCLEPRKRRKSRFCCIISGLDPWVQIAYSGTVTDVQSFRSVSRAIRAIRDGSPATLFTGDCLELIRKIPDESVDLTITSPPYCIGKEYEDSRSVEDFITAQKNVLPEIVRITRDGGSICWQTGYHVTERSVYPLDFAIFAILKDLGNVVLRNRVIWAFGFGLNPVSRLSGRHETVLWFTKGDSYSFDLDAVRVPQKYPGKRRYKGPRKGELSCNPKGKNPGDVWEIPNVRFGHMEKTGHPCQFPVALAERFVRALCPKLGVVFDPYSGSASTGVAAAINERRFIGAEINEEYQEIARARLTSAYSGTVKFRPAEQPIYIAGIGEAVARRPAEFLEAIQ